MLPRSLTKRLVNHARPSDVTEGYAADWTVEQLREPAQCIADRIDELMQGPDPARTGPRRSDAAPTTRQPVGERARAVLYDGRSCDLPQSSVSPALALKRGYRK